VQISCAAGGILASWAYMHKLTILGCLALVAIPFVAQADRVSCSNATHYNSDHGYKRGDLVWWHDGGNVYYEYQCDRDECNNDASESAKNGHDQPGHGSTWKYVGMCDKDPG
jgi:hypothetical protein